MGFGRSYGQESKFFGKIFSGILQSGLWEALDHARPLPTMAIIADVGNDLAYQSPVEAVVGWVAEALDRLAAHDARAVLNNVPIESLRSVGRMRYRLLRAILFPRCRLPRDEMLARADALSRSLADLAETREIPVFSRESASYGFDPIHPRRCRAGVVWRRMIEALDTCAGPPPWRRPRRRDARLLRRLQAQFWSQIAMGNDAAPPVARLADGTTVTLF
jgi:hypothetical protein